MKTVEQMVAEFHTKYGHLINTKPIIEISPEVANLRHSLIEEEYFELSDGLLTNDLVEIADGAADLVYVIIGTCLSYGIPFTRIFYEVHNSNMTKTPSKAYEGQKYGEVNPKGPEYTPPDIKGILEHPERLTQLELRSVGCTLPGMPSSQPQSN